MARSNYRKEYNAWKAAQTRCYNPKFNKYAYYGGRGIKMSDEWRASFDQFLADMGPAPGPGYSLDRHPDKNGNYCKGNCRWATQTTQCRNTRRNTLVMGRGETHCVSEWAEILGIPRGRILQWLHRHPAGTIDQYLAKPPREYIAAAGRPTKTPSSAPCGLFCTDYRGHRYRALERMCECCGKAFLAPEYRVKMGRGKFCSIGCAPYGKVGKPFPPRKKV